MTRRTVLGRIAARQEQRTAPASESPGSGQPPEPTAGAPRDREQPEPATDLDSPTQQHEVLAVRNATDARGESPLSPTPPPEPGSERRPRSADGYPEAATLVRGKSVHDGGYQTRQRGESPGWR